MNYRIEKKLVHGEWVEVKVYLPSRCLAASKLKFSRGAGSQRGALHVARESGQLESIHGL